MRNGSKSRPLPGAGRATPHPPPEPRRPICRFDQLAFSNPSNGHLVLWRPVSTWQCMSFASCCPSLCMLHPPAESRRLVCGSVAWFRVSCSPQLFYSLFRRKRLGTISTTGKSTFFSLFRLSAFNAFQYFHLKNPFSVRLQNIVTVACQKIFWNIGNTWTRFVTFFDYPNVPKTS